MPPSRSRRLSQQASLFEAGTQGVARYRMPHLQTYDEWCVSAAGPYANDGGSSGSNRVCTCDSGYRLLPSGCDLGSQGEKKCRCVYVPPPPPPGAVDSVSNFISDVIEWLGPVGILVVIVLAYWYCKDLEAKEQSRPEPVQNAQNPMSRS